MRQAIMSVVLSLALAGVASALPTISNGGTFYLNYTLTTGQQVIKYVDVNSNWAALDSNGAVATGTTNPFYTFATITDTHAVGTLATGNLGYGAISALSGQTAFHGANILVGASYNLISVNSASQTLLNSNADSSLNGLGFAIAVDSHFTPAGTGSGIIVGLNQAGTEAYNVYTQASPGVYTTHAAVQAPFPGVNTNAMCQPAYASFAGYSIGGTLVNGVLFEADPNSGGGYMYLSYHKSDGSGYLVMPRFNVAGANAVAIKGSSGIFTNVAVGDTNGNGIPDFYYMNSTGAMVHAEDKNADGVLDSGEAAAMNLSWASVPTNLDATNPSQAQNNVQLIQGSDGSYALAMFRSRYNTANNYPRLMVASLDANGNYNGTETMGPPSDPLTIGQNIYPTSYDPANIYGQPSIVFVATAPSQMAPEPATLMLLGTGFLGLVGIIRRRMII